MINKIAKNFNYYLIFFDEDYNDLIKFKKEINHVVFTILTSLEKNNIFEKKLVPVKIKKYKKESINTEIFYSLTNHAVNLENNKINFDIFINKPSIKIFKNNYFLGGLHYSTYFKIFKSNFKSNKIFNLSDKELIDKICSLKYKIDFSFYDKIYCLICEELGINNNSDSLEKYIKNSLKEENVYNKDLFNKIEEKKTNEEVDEEKKIFQKKYNKLLEYYLFLKIKEKLKNLDYFYMGLTFDFRGRLYPKSCISPIGIKIIRYLYFYGYYSENELNNIDICDVSEDHKKIIKGCLLFKIFNNVNLNNKIHVFYAYICLFEIGKIFKSHLSFSKNGIFDNTDILEYGCEVTNSILKNLKNLSFDEKLEYTYIISALEDLNKGVYKKIIIYKDATASGIQLLTVVHGCKNEEILKYCNLRSYDKWYDTYHYIINIFINKNIKKLKKLAANDYIDYLNRKDLKRSIMTYIYGAGQKTALMYYLDNLAKKLDEEIGIKIFKLFYNFLDEFFSSTEFFESSIDFIKNKAKLEQTKNNKIVIRTADFSTIRLDYYKYITYRLDRIIEKKRSTIKYGFIDPNLFDEEKTYRALIANIAQGLDALFLRLILKELDYPIITIHDCFGIDILNTNQLIKVANTAMNKISYSFESDFSSFNNFKLTNYYSIHILI